MKKVLVVLSIVLILTIGTVVAYAADSDLPTMKFPWRDRNELSEESIEELLKERAEFRKNEIERALKEGKITESEAKEWEDHFEYMDEFHSKNGFMNGGRGYGRGCNRIMRGNRF